MKTWIIERSVKLAKTSTYHPYLHGAIVESGGRVLAMATNSARPFKGAFSTHAEIAALAKAGLLAKDADLYVSRFCPSGRMGLSRPCPDCHKAIEAAGIKRVFYSTETGWERL